MIVNENTILDLAAKGESETLEFKRSFDKDAIEAITAFANTKGGIILVGVDDDGDIRGTTVNKETIQNWLNNVKQATVPSVIPDMETVEVGKKKVIFIKVVEYPIKPVAVKGRYIKRVKNSNHHMDINEVTNLHLKTFNTSWDYYIDNNHSVEDISLEKVRKFIELANKHKDVKNTDDPVRVLNKFELVRENKITYGGYLLFVEGHSGLTTIELGRFQTPAIIKDSVTLKDDLISEVEAVMDFIKKHINKAYIFTGNVQREERWDYPLDAIREIVVNAIVHRDYRDASDSVIKIFDDRIEFYNPGKLPEGLSIEILLSGDYTSTIRNKKIAEIFKEANIIEKYGSGIGRILDEFEAYGLPAPKFEEIGNGFRATAFKEPIKSDRVKDRVNDRVKDRVKDRVNDNSSIYNEKDTTKSWEKEPILLQKIKENPAITAVELSKMLNINERNIRKYLSKLKKEGKLKRMGSDKKGIWEIIEE
ncbi:MAG: winged helix-turn-helix transcriptional regulator [bacterium]|nr:winged helix-turn-helix transcriptional regulator [bacterium]